MKKNMKINKVISVILLIFISILFSCENYKNKEFIIQGVWKDCGSEMQLNGLIFFIDSHYSLDEDLNLYEDSIKVGKIIEASKDKITIELNNGEKCYYCWINRAVNK